RITQAIGERDANWKIMQVYAKNMEELKVVAPRSGIVINPPRIDDVGKSFDVGRTMYAEQAMPFCSIGDPSELGALMPVPPDKYRLMRDDLDEAKAHGSELAVTIRVQGRAASTWQGQISQLPESEAREIPIQLTNKGGGNIVAKATARPGLNVPPQS